MKTEYDKALYDFFIQEENFIPAARIATQLKGVATQLVESYWKDLEEALKKRRTDWVEGWSIRITDRFEKRYVGLEIIHEDWKIEGRPLVSIRFEDLQFSRSPFVGYWINRDIKGKVALDNIFNDIRALEILDEYEHDSHNWWIKWKWLQYIDFKDYEKLESILPANKENAIDQCVSEVTTLQDLAFEKVSTIVKKYS